MSDIPTATILGWMDEATALARSYFKEVVGQRKQDRSWVSAADLEIEQLLIARVKAQFPEHGILGEESGAQHGSGADIWAIDPIDGTQSFLQGLPGWSISLGLIRNGRPLYGFVSIPSTDDHYWCDDQGAYCNGKAIHVRETATIGKGDWIALTSRSHQSFRLGFPGKVRGFGSIASHLCYVARDAAVAALLGGEGRGACGILPLGWRFCARPAVMSSPSTGRRLPPTPCMAG
ncbi:MAG: inositol-phosphate phosphatase [Oscillochloris sp.]|nr:inositol-phosphate phosphatase [Oscillochloris sp.]